MDLFVKGEDVWVTSISDDPGSLGKTLGLLSDAGANLDFIISRRAPDEPETAVVFVTPLRADHEVQAGDDAGFSVTRMTYSVRVEGENKPGIAAKLAGAVGDAGINMVGFSAAKLGARFVAHIRVETMEEREAVIKLLSAL